MYLWIKFWCVLDHSVLTNESERWRRVRILPVRIMDSRFWPREWTAVQTLFPQPGGNHASPTGRSCADVWKSLAMHLIWNNRKLKRLSQVCVLASQISSGILVNMDQKWPYPVKGRNPCYPRSIKFQLSKVLTCTDLLYNSITAVHNTVLYTWKIKRTDLLIRTLWVFLPKLKKENAKKIRKICIKTG